jgi:hypothetical protein
MALGRFWRRRNVSERHEDLSVPVSLTFVGGEGEQADVPPELRARRVLKLLQPTFGFRVA